MPEMIEVDKEKFIKVLESLQRKVPRLSRHSFSMAFDAAVAIEAQRALVARSRTREEWENGLIRDHQVFERKMKKIEEETEKKIAYLRSLQVEALEYYDGKQVEEEEDRKAVRVGRSRTGFKHDGGGPRGCYFKPSQE